MTVIILAVDDKPEELKALVDNLQAVFPQESVAAFGGALFALQYVFRHPKEIGLVFTAMTMRMMDGITVANSVAKSSPGAAIFFMVQEENSELSAIAKQHGNGNCLSKPVTVESIRQAASSLQEALPWEDEDCDKGVGVVRTSNAQNDCLRKI